MQNNVRYAIIHSGNLSGCMNVSAEKAEAQWRDILSDKGGSFDIVELRVGGVVKHVELTPSSSQAAKLSDDELLAEVKRRNWLEIKG